MERLGWGLLPLFVSVRSHHLSIYDSTLSEGLDPHWEGDFGKALPRC